MTVSYISLLNLYYIKGRNYFYVKWISSVIVMYRNLRASAAVGLHDAVSFYLWSPSRLLMLQHQSDVVTRLRLSLSKSAGRLDPRICFENSHTREQIKVQFLREHHSIVIVYRNILS